jgi:hypothetical protein
MSRKERPVRVASVWKRSPIRRFGTTYIDTAMEKTKAMPETMPGSARGSKTRKKR